MMIHLLVKYSSKTAPHALHCFLRERLKRVADDELSISGVIQYNV